MSLSVELLQKPSYTPPRRELPLLITLYLDSATPTHEQLITTVLRRTAADAFAAALARLPETERPARARLVALCGRLLSTLADRLGQAAPVDAFLALIFDDDATAARQAVQAIGKLPPIFSPRVEPALLERFSQARDPADLRALAATLGKLGGEKSLAALRTIDAKDETLLSQIVERAVLRSERSTQREKAAAAPIRIDRELPSSYPLVLRCRAGLTAILADELRARGLTRDAKLSISEPATLGPKDGSGQLGRVSFLQTRPLSTLFAARTWSSLAFALPGRAKPAARLDDLAEVIIDALTHAQTRALLRTLNGDDGPLRYRLHFADGGHRRALVWRIATEVRRRAPELLNDPTDSPFSVEISDRAPDSLAIELIPRLTDPRFAYHLRDVPAASHPPIAAALARLAEVGADDAVWDPFVGSGSELIEIALSTPCRRLFGTDLDPAAIAIAQENIAAAGLRSPITLAQADALRFSPPTPRLTRIVTNPPMGRRTRPGQLSEFLVAFLAHAAACLAPRGRLVYITPQPRVTTPRAKDLGLKLLSVRPVDLHGFWGSLEVWEKP